MEENLGTKVTATLEMVFYSQHPLTSDQMAKGFVCAVMQNDGYYINNIIVFKREGWDNSESEDTVDEED